MTTKTNNQTQPQQVTEPAPRSEHTNLSYHYGSIGIQAVAAAARYSDVRKKPAHASGGERIDLRFVESAV
jgi:hypothetical protein